MAPHERSAADPGNTAAKSGATRIAPALLNEAVVVLSAVLVTSVSGLLLASSRLSINLSMAVSAAILLLIIFASVVHALPSHGHQRFGHANTVTAIRAAIVSIVGAMVFSNGAPSGGASTGWMVSALVVVALALDGVDGYLARRFGQESALGARFDMEIDALLILILSIACMLLEKAGWWVLLIGLMRYIFVAAQYVVPDLGKPLPVSYRRKLICVIQVGSLCVNLIPIVTPPVSIVIAALALATLSYSFATDTLYLLRHRASAE